MSLKKLPIVLLLGAKSSKNPLPEIPKELSKLEMLFSRHKYSKPSFELVHLPYFNQGQLKTKLDILAGRVSVLHFAGHSDGKGLVTDDEDDDQEMVYSHHITDHIRSWSQPPLLVFLNGCNNASQVRAFHSANVAVVIATHRAINDRQAAEFAREFYTKLFIKPTKTSLQSAFEQAGANILMSEDSQFRAPNMDSLANGDSNTLDWGVYPQHDDQLQWSLSDLITRERPILDNQGQLHNPYKGLEAFQEQDKYWFFGRGKLINELTQAIPNTNFYTLMGASGSGKSSLINAGVLPRLREAGHASILHCSPGGEPFKEVAKVFAHRFHPDSVSRRLREQKALAEDLQAQLLDLADLVEQVLEIEKSTHLFLIIDQFEELFTQSEKPVVQAFITQLTDLLMLSLDDCTLVLIMRADFLPAALAYPTFAQLMDSNPHKLLSPMSEAELREAIEKPAEKQQVTLEPSLTGALLDAVENETGSLPLLQYMLNLLWDKRQAQILRLEDYIAFGGLEKALESRANEVYQKLTEIQRGLCKRVFLCLIQPGEGAEDTRRRAYLEEFTVDELPIITTLADARLITIYQKNKDEQAYTEVSHEALIRHWPLLREWIEEKRDEWRIQLQIIADAKEWELNNQGEDWLLRGGQLELAEAWLENNSQYPVSNEVTFIEASIKQHEVLLGKKKKQRERELNLLERIKLTNEDLQFSLSALYIERVESIVSDDFLCGKVSRSQAETRKAWLYGLDTINYNLVRKKPDIPSSPTRSRNREVECLYGRLSAIREQDLSTQLNEAHMSIGLKNKGQKEIPVIPSFFGGQGLGCITYSSDGTRFFSTRRNRIDVWNALNAEGLDVFVGHQSLIYSLAYLSDKNILISAGEDKEIYFWNPNKGLIVKILKGHIGGILTIAASPDEKTLASGSDDNSIYLWDIDTGKVIQTLYGHTKNVNIIVYSLDGRFFFSGSDDGTIRQWNAKNGEFIKDFHSNNGAISALAYSSDSSSQIIASGSVYGSITLWDIESSEVIMNFREYYGQISVLKYSPDGKLLFSGAKDGTIRFYDSSTGQVIRTISENSGILSLALSPEGGVIATMTGSGSIRQWESSCNVSPSLLQGQNGHVYVLEYSPKGHEIISGSGDSNIYVWSTKTGEILRTLQGHTGKVYALSYSHDGKTIASGSHDKSIRIWDAISGGLLCSLLGHQDAVTVIDHHSDGKLIASSSTDKTIRIWELDKQTCINTLVGHTNTVEALAFHPSGEKILSGSRDATLRIWDVESGGCDKLLKGHSRAVYIVKYSPNGAIFASGSLDGTIRIWDSVSGGCIGVLRQYPEEIFSLAFHPLKQIIAAGGKDGSVYLWDLNNGTVLQTLRGHSNEVWALNFSPDGKVLTSGAKDNLLRMWALDSPIHRLVYEFSPDEVLSAVKCLWKIDLERSQVVDLNSKSYKELKNKYATLVATPPRFGETKLGQLVRFLESSNGSKPTF